MTRVRGVHRASSHGPSPKMSAELPGSSPEYFPCLPQIFSPCPRTLVQPYQFAAVLQSSFPSSSIRCLTHREPVFSYEHEKPHQDSVSLRCCLFVEILPCASKTSYFRGVSVRGWKRQLEPRVGGRPDRVTLWSRCDPSRFQLYVRAVFPISLQAKAKPPIVN